MSYMEFETYDLKFVDIHGEPIERTPFKYPYNYDDYVIWKDDSNFELDDSAVYSDRLFQWDPEKYSKCCKDAFKNKGQGFYDGKPEEIEKFLSMYFDKQIKLTAIMQGCNQIYGNPYWIFFYKN